MGQRPILYLVFSHAWVSLMLATTMSTLFIRDYRLPNVAGYTLIHLFVLATFISLFRAFWYLARKNINRHWRLMQGLYFGGRLGAGAFTLLPRRYLGHVVWHQWLD
jgi:uncharacterized membrane protein